MAEDNNSAVQQKPQTKFDLSEDDLIELEPDLVIVEDDISIDDWVESREDGQSPAKLIRWAVEPQGVEESSVATTADSDPTVQQEPEKKFDLSVVDIKVEPDLVIVEDEDSIDGCVGSRESGQPPAKRVRWAVEPQGAEEIRSGETEGVQRQAGASSSRNQGLENNMSRLLLQEVRRQMGLGMATYSATFYKQTFFCHQTGPGNFAKFNIIQPEKDGLASFKMYLQQASFNTHIVNNSVVFERHASGRSSSTKKFSCNVFEGPRGGTTSSYLIVTSFSTRNITKRFAALIQRKDGVEVYLMGYASKVRDKTVQGKALYRIPTLDYLVRSTEQLRLNMFHNILKWECFVKDKTNLVDSRSFGIPSWHTVDELLALGCVWSFSGVTHLRSHMLSYIGKEKDWAGRRHAAASRCQLTTGKIDFDNDYSLIPILWSDTRM